MKIVGIETGHYIRFQKGGIHKICETYEKYFVLENHFKVPYAFLDRINGFKTGTTKLELICPGDIVNNKIVDRVTTGMIALNYCKGCGLWEEVIDNDKAIKTILTKEQYENDSYKEGSF